MSREERSPDHIRYSEVTRSSLYDAHGHLHVNERRVELDISGDVAEALLAAGVLALIGGLAAAAAVALQAQESSSPKQKRPARSLPPGQAVHARHSELPGG